MEKNNALTNCYPEAKSVVVSGDIHGDFNELVYKLCIQYQMTDTLLIVAGDCGFGFEKKAKHDFDSNLSDGIPRAYYWSDESPVYDEKKMDAIRSAHSIDIVITHTAPSCCELQTKSGLTRWAADDPELLADVQTERTTMDQLLHRLQADRHPISHWYYGHFHQSWHATIDGILYRMLDIMEFCMVY